MVILFYRWNLVIKIRLKNQKKNKDSYHVNMWFFFVFSIFENNEMKILCPLFHYSVLLIILVYIFYTIIFCLFICVWKFIQILFFCPNNKIYKMAITNAEIYEQERKKKPQSSFFRIFVNDLKIKLNEW